MHRRTWLSVIAIVVFSSCGVVEEVSADLKDDVLAGWKQIERATSVTNLQRTSILPGRNGPSSRIDHWAVQGDAKKLETKQRVWLYSDGISYVLRKNENNAWQVEQRGSLDAFPDLGGLRGAAFSIADVCLLDAIKDEKFAFSDWREGDDGYVHFQVRNIEEAQLNASGIKHRPAAFEEVQIRVDPEHSCRIVGFEHDVFSQGLAAHIAAKYEYGDDAFIPQRIATASTALGREPAEWTIVNTSISHKPLPESEFTLSHYGL
ncbi:MAG: hypothetical protein KDB22_04495 [Planctomycetales bacterium]|nr:hypothetical protein [Planctomycetales bacterium]